MTNADYKNIQDILANVSATLKGSDIPPKVRVALQVILIYSSGAAHDAALPVMLQYLAPAKVDVKAAVGPFESGKIL